jgi:antirestriction protein ArdC
MKTDVYQIVTDRIMERLEQGEVPWINTRTKPLMWARSATTGRQYRGINAILLSNSHFASCFWITYKTAASMKGNVKKGSKGSLCVFFKMYETDEKVVNRRGEEENKRIPILRYYNVFNLEQTEGIADPLLDLVSVPNPIEAAESVISGYAGKPDLVYGSSGLACYRSTDDHVVIPQQNAFTTPAQYYRTVFHEFVHSTGHSSRLDRWNGDKLVSDHDRALEELVAEMGASMLLAECGLFDETFDKYASYISHWLHELKNDSKLVVKAAGRAQRAVDLILGRSFQDAEHVEPLAAAA